MFVLIPYSFDDEIAGREPAAAKLVGVGNLGTGADAVGKSAVSDGDVIYVNAVPPETLAAVGRSLVVVDCLELVNIVRHESEGRAEQEDAILDRLVQLSFEEICQVVVMSRKPRGDRVMV